MKNVEKYRKSRDMRVNETRNGKIAYQRYIQVSENL